ncbi:MAG: bifunctional nuclease family protein [Candidatus Tectomicrobia bacterium]|nr:bifunctional nuclease family protein [Candidatus Tectomicrobia bacterium]
MRAGRAGTLCLWLTVLVVMVWLGVAPALRAAENVEMRVAGVAEDPLSNSPIVVLEDLKGDVAFPIWVGLTEAQAIMLELEGVRAPRPLTHDLVKRILESVNSRVAKITVTDLRDNTFFARVTLERGGEMSDIDSRPSDAIALALRFKAPIYVNSALFERVSAVHLKQRTSQDLVRRRLGLAVQDLTPPLAEAFEMPGAEGVLIAGVGGSSPAARDGVKRGDVIVEVNGAKVKNVDELDRLLRTPPAEAALMMVVLRGKETLRLTIHTTPAPPR